MGYSHKYRADGMRVRKSKNLTPSPIYTEYYYDGQMPVEEYNTRRFIQARPSSR